MGKQRQTTSTKSTEDLLSTIKRDKKFVGDEYLKTSDLYETPVLTNEDYYPNSNRPLQVGSSPMSHVGGSNPIFVGEGGTFPMAPIAKRMAALDKAAVQAKLYNIAVDEKKKDDAAKTKGKLNDLMGSKEVPMQYNVAFQQEPYAILEKYKTMAANDPQFANDTDRNNDLADFDSGKYGNPMARELVSHKAYGENLNQMAEVSTEIEKAIAENKFVPEGLRKANQEFNEGKFKGQDADRIALNVKGMTVGAAMIPLMTSFINSFDSDKSASGVQQVDPAKVQQSAQGFIDYNFGGGNLTGLNYALGIPLNSDSKTTADVMTKMVVERHGRQQDPPKDQTEGERKYDKQAGTIVDNFLIKFYHQGKEQTWNADMFMGFNTGVLNVSNAAGTVDMGNDRYMTGADPSFKFEPTGIAGGEFYTKGKGSAKEKRLVVTGTKIEYDKNDYAKTEKELTESGSINNNTSDDEIAKLVIAEMEAKNQQSVKRSSVAVPLNALKGTLEGKSINVGAAEKRWEEKQKSTKKPIVAPTTPKDGDERAVQGGTAIYKNGKWQMK